MKNFLELFKTNGTVNTQTQWIIGIVWLACITAFWTISRYSVLPNAPEVAAAGLQQWQQGAAAELITSFGISLQSILIAAILGSAIAYAQIEFKRHYRYFLYGYAQRTCSQSISASICHCGIFCK